MILASSKFTLTKVSPSLSIFQHIVIRRKKNVIRAIWLFSFDMHLHFNLEFLAFSAHHFTSYSIFETCALLQFDWLICRAQGRSSSYMILWLMVEMESMLTSWFLNYRLFSSLFFPTYSFPAFTGWSFLWFAGLITLSEIAVRVQ